MPPEEAVIHAGLEVAAAAEVVCEWFAAEPPAEIAALRAACEAFGRLYGEWMESE